MCGSILVTHHTNQDLANNSTSPRYSKTNLLIRKIFVYEPLKKRAGTVDRIGRTEKTLLPDFSKNSTFILKNSALISIFASIISLIFNMRLSNSPSIHQFYYLDSTILRSQTFSIRLDDKSRVGTRLHWYLTQTHSKIFINNLSTFCFSMLIWHDTKQGLALLTFAQKNVFLTASWCYYNVTIDHKWGARNC